MAETRPFLSLVNEETARLKWFEAFMRGRVELEQQTISGLQALLENAPPLLDSKLLWHRALEKLLDGTRDELHARIEELERLKDQMQAVGTSIANAEMYIRDLNIELEKLESTEGVDSARAATATLYGDWIDIKLAEVSVQKILSKPFSSRKTLEYEKSLKVREVFAKYYKQDLSYRRIVLQQRQSQELFLNSIPHRVQEYGLKYWTAVCDVGVVMESFSNYLRNIASTCNSSGSAIWASAKNIKPLVDANCHTEAIEFADRQSPTRFPPVHYLNPGSRSRSPSGQTILFGCPLELCTVGGLKKIPPVLEYLLDALHQWNGPYYRPMGLQAYWSLANQLEQAWTGVEESDRAIVSRLTRMQRFLIVEYFLALPEPVWSENDVSEAREVVRNPSSLIRNTWNKDPTKLAVLRAIVSCFVRLRRAGYFNDDMIGALAQNLSFFYPDDVLESLSRNPDFWKSPGSSVMEGNQ